MRFDLDDTIAAIASAPGGGLRGIVRLSGSGCQSVVSQVFAAADECELSSFKQAACLNGMIQLPRELGAIQARLYLWPDARSYTRQPAAELHLLGSPPLVEAVLEAACSAGARLARPGEFTLRAFLAGRLDLTQAEAVLGVIDARGEGPLQTALAQLAGGLAGPLAELRESLLDLLAHLEAGLDFVDEDIEFISTRELQEQLAAAEGQVARLEAKMTARQQSHELPRVVLIGEPNAGKSSLFNALAGRAAALVSDQAGTTRDFVAAPLALDGGECLLIDTAGVSFLDDAGTLAGAAQAVTGEQQRQADVTVLCLDASRAAAATVEPAESPAVIVWTKCDLAPDRSPPPELPGAIATSSRTGAGLEQLRQALRAALDQHQGEAGVVASTAGRCRESLALATAALRRARELAGEHRGEELVAAELRLALDGLGQVVGAVYTDDVLDRVFSRFCIGK